MRWYVTCNHIESTRCLIIAKGRKLSDNCEKSYFFVKCRALQDWDEICFVSHVADKMSRVQLWETFAIYHSGKLSFTSVQVLFVKQQTNFAPSTWHQSVYFYFFALLTIQSKLTIRHGADKKAMQWTEPNGLDIVICFADKALSDFVTKVTLSCPQMFLPLVMGSILFASHRHQCLWWHNDTFEMCWDNCNQELITAVNIYFTLTWLYQIYLICVIFQELGLVITGTLPVFNKTNTGTKVG